MDSSKETNPEDKEYTQEDILCLFKLYKVSIITTRYFWMLYPMKKMLADLNVILSKYKIEKLNENNPTQRKLESTLRKALKKAQEFREMLQPLGTDEGLHFWGAIISAKAGGEKTDEIEDKKYDRLMEEIEKNGGDLMRSLKWFIEGLSLCEQFQYPYVKESHARKKPETQFIQDMSVILTKYFTDGGFWRGEYVDQNSAEGWRIDCLEHLLQRVEIKKTRNQILDAISAGNYDT